MSKPFARPCGAAAPNLLDIAVRHDRTLAWRCPSGLDSLEALCEFGPDLVALMGEIVDGAREELARMRPAPAPAVANPPRPRGRSQLALELFRPLPNQRRDR